MGINPSSLSSSPIFDLILALLLGLGRRLSLTAGSSYQSLGGDSVWEQVDSESGNAGRALNH